MRKDEIREKLTSLRRWKRGSYKAPHKPLLVLYMLSHYWHCGDRMVYFRLANGPLCALISRFNLMRPQQLDALTPFWQMQGEEGLWELTGASHLRDTASSSRDTRPNFRQSYDSKLAGGFTEPVYLKLIQDKVFLIDMVFLVLNKYFPKHLHIEILNVLGIPNGDVEALYGKLKLQDEVLNAYGHRCSVCDFSNLMHHKPICIEVAHIQWESEGGPNQSDNLMVFCSLHRNLFNHGAFTLSADYSIDVSKKFKPPEVGSSRMLTDYHGKQALVPETSSMQPGMGFLDWHKHNVFQ